MGPASSISSLCRRSRGPPHKKVSIFFDGQNFYRSLLRYDETLRVDYDRLATWITEKVGGPNATFSGAYYYVGVRPNEVGGDFTGPKPVQTLEGFYLTPCILGRNLGLSPVTVFLCVLAGGFLFGPLGMLLAAPIAAVAAIVWRSVQRQNPRV